ncbi:MAG: hypothetical protein ACK4VK_00630 [Aquificaceae bacterium]
MNILIVSFDKTLVDKLRDVLRDYSLVNAKNVEEVLKSEIPSVDVVIYDAVAGSISEEEINNLYRQRFKEAKYIILIDDLFPVDMNNIDPPKKMGILREEAAEKIKEVILKEPEDFSTSKEIFETKEEPQPKSKLLVISFDPEIVKSLKEALSKKVQIIEAKTLRETMEKAKDADIILFDTILGMLAYRTLMDMSKEEEFRKKPFILLIEELSTIDTEIIPLLEKYTFTRTTELSKAIQKVFELTEQETPQTPNPLEETLQETPEEASQEVLAEQGIPQELTAQEETLQKAESLQASPEPEKSPQVPAPKVEDIIMAVEEAIKGQLSEERLYSLISQAINYQDLKAHISELIEVKIEKTIDEKIQAVFSSINIAQIIREEAHKVLKERLRDLIT